MRIGSISQLITVSVLTAWPDQTRSSCARARPAREPQLHGAHRELIEQPARQVGERLQQRKAVDLQPQRRVDVAGRTGRW